MNQGNVIKFSTLLEHIRANMVQKTQQTSLSLRQNNPGWVGIRFIKEINHSHIHCPPCYHFY